MSPGDLIRCPQCSEMFRAEGRHIRRLKSHQRACCSQPCGARFRNGMTSVDRLNSRLDKSGECWLWTGSKIWNGYGMIRHEGKRLLAHRAAWIAAYGEIPDGLMVLHRCDVRSCCNPSHLFLGTHDDNMKDMIKKGRAVILRGEKCGSSKLKEGDVRKIRSMAAEGKPTREISIAFKVSKNTVTRIVSRWAWKHVT